MLAIQIFDNFSLKNGVVAGFLSENGDFRLMKCFFVFIRLLHNGLRRPFIVVCKNSKKLIFEPDREQFAGFDSK